MCEEAFGLPDWFGMNWDALEECLGDLDHGERRGRRRAVGRVGRVLAEAAPQEFATALDILGGAVRGWAPDGVRGGVAAARRGPRRRRARDLTRSRQAAVAGSTGSAAVSRQARRPA